MLKTNLPAVVFLFFLEIHEENVAEIKRDAIVIKYNDTKLTIAEFNKTVFLVSPV